MDAKQRKSEASPFAPVNAATPGLINAHEPFGHSLYEIVRRGGHFRDIRRSSAAGGVRSGLPEPTDPDAPRPRRNPVALLGLSERLRRTALGRMILDFCADLAASGRSWMPRSDEPTPIRQMLLNLAGADEADDYRKDIIPCDDEPDDEDEPTEDEVTTRMRSRNKQYTTGSHASELVHGGRPWREPEPLEVVVREGKAAARRLRRTLAVPAAERYANYVSQQAWSGAERGKYAAKKGKGKSKAKGAAA